MYSKSKNQFQNLFLKATQAVKIQDPINLKGSVYTSAATIHMIPHGFSDGLIF